MPTCPNCRHTWTAPKRTKAPPATPARADLTDAQLFAHFKQTAPAEDLRFWLETAHMSPGLRLWFQGLELARPNLSRPEFYRELKALQDRWRAEDYWRTVVLPATRTARRLAYARTRQLNTSTKGRIAA